MLRGEFEADEQSPAELRSAYDTRLGEVIDAVGPETVAERTGVDVDTLSALVDGESPELTLEEAASILATDEDLPDAGSIEAEALDILLLGMSMAVLDVEAVASGIDDAMDPKEIQQKAEGRYPMTLDEYALLHSFIESRR
jgi:hypothetical protein